MSGTEAKSPGAEDGIETAIAETGVAVVVVSEALPCSGCGQVHDPGAEDAFAYTVGRAERALPELLSTMIYPREAAHVQSVMTFLDERERAGHPVRDGQMVDDGEGGVWVLVEVPDPYRVEYNDMYTLKARERAGGDVRVLLLERKERWDSLEAPAQPAAVH